jgi:hypothetical protein
MSVQGSNVLAVFFGILAALSGLLFVRLKWAPGVDFDVTGFFWLLENAGRVSVLLLFIIFAGAALAYWLRSYLSER